MMLPKLVHNPKFQNSKDNSVLLLYHIKKWESFYTTFWEILLCKHGHFPKNLTAEKEYTAKIIFHNSIT